MTSPSLELQGVIVARLKADVAVAAIVEGGVFDRVPRNKEGQIAAPYPLVGVGEGDETTEDADCIPGRVIALTIHCWSREVGFPQVKRLAEAVRASLHARDDISLTDNALVQLEHQQTRFLNDPDGLTTHAVLTFEAFVEQPA